MQEFHSHNSGRRPVRESRGCNCSKVIRNWSGKTAQFTEYDLNDAAWRAPVGEGQGGLAGEPCAVCFFDHGWCICRAAFELIVRVAFGGTELNCKVVSSPVWRRFRVMK